MALTRVRAQFDGQWYELTYNSATHAYEAEITPPATSFHQPGGYYNITAEAVNDSGVTTVTDGENIPGLRLVVLEKKAPTLTLVAPAAGYVATNTPVIILEAVDEAGGSGVDKDALSVHIDGAEISDAEFEAITDGYQISCAVTTPLTEGRHTLTASIRDNDGNLTELSAAYIVDTVPPSLYASPLPVLVDVESVRVTGITNDVTGPPVVVTVTNNGSDTGAVEVKPDGAFIHTVPLEVGENFLTLKATDGAGLVSQREYYMIRLITDRTQTDVNDLAAIVRALKLGNNGDPEAGRAVVGDAVIGGYIQEFLRARHRGAYNYTDLNRVTTAMEYLDRELYRRGYVSGYVPIEPGPGRTDWEVEDLPSVSETRRYLDNVDGIRKSVLVPANAPETPPDMEGFTYGEANDIEKILVTVDALFPLMDTAVWYCGEIGCGEY